MIYNTSKASLPNIMKLEDPSFLWSLVESSSGSEKNKQMDYLKKLENETGLKSILLGTLTRKSIVSIVDMPDEVTTANWSKFELLVGTIYETLTKEKVSHGSAPNNFFIIASYHDESYSIFFGSPQTEMEKETDFYPFVRDDHYTLDKALTELRQGLHIKF